jgi:hypothetical protein
VTLLVAFDPGKATGVFVGAYTAKSPLRPVSHHIVQNGPEGMGTWLRGMNSLDAAEVVSELFRPNLNDPGARETVSPRVEGVLCDHIGEARIHWQPRNEKAMGFESQAVSDLLLRRLGWWVTGKDVDHTDGRDANDASIHALQYLRKKRHVPTLRMISEAMRKPPAGD